MIASTASASMVTRAPSLSRASLGCSLLGPGGSRGEGLVWSPVKGPHDTAAPGFTGVGWAAETHAVCVMDAGGKIVAGFTIEHSADGIAALIRRLARHGDPGDM